MKTKIDTGKLRIAMIRRGIASYKELAELSGVADGTIYKALAGENFTMQTLDSLATSLAVNPFDVLDTTEHPKPAGLIEVEY